VVGDIECDGVRREGREEEEENDAAAVAAHVTRYDKYGNDGANGRWRRF
jgi:hypothetical protein